MTKLTDAFQLRPWTLEDKGKHFFKENQRINRIEEDDDTQVYKKPWVGLTDDEAISAVSSVLPVPSTGGQTHHLQIQYKYALEIAQTIEAKLKEKNT